MKKIKKETKTKNVEKKQKVEKNNNIKQTNNVKTKKKFKIDKQKVKLVFKILLIIFVVIIIACMVGAGLFLSSIVKNAPEFDPNNLYQQESTILYDSEGKIIAKLGTEKREKITFEEMPEVLVDAIIATEDSRFFQHNGFDLPRFLKASMGQLMGQDAGGASTLTMQISKNSFSKSTVATGIAGIKRKFTDIYMSIFKIEKNYTKKEIIEFYANYNFLGGTSVINGGAYGVEQACLTYFGKSAKDINLAEAALIAGLFQAPYSYDPYLYPEDAEERRQTVLYLMERHGYITAAQREIAEQLTVDKLILKEPTSTGGEYQHFIDMVVTDVIDVYAEQGIEVNPYDTPMEIWTTMDRTKQDHINSIMTGTESPVTGSIYEWQNDVVDAGISVIDVNTGAIVAIGGGRKSDGLRQFNNATMIERQIGSTAKPLYDYGPGIEYNNWSTYTPFTDEPHTYSNGIKISNWNYRYNGFLTLRESVMGSWNIPALKAFQSVSKSNIKDFVLKLGLSPELEDGVIHEAHALGGYNGESPLTLSAAYAAFANGGYYIKPYSFTKAVFRDTGETYETKVQKTRAMGADTAYMIADVLVSTAPSALGRYSYVNGVTYGAKTGTTNFTDNIFKQYNLPSNAVNDIWVAGISPKYSIAVWYGYDQIYSDYYNVISSGQNSRIFQAIAKGIFTEHGSFSKPSNVVSVTVEKETYPAMLPSEFTPKDKKTTELFKRGTEPTDVSNRFAKLENVSNLKAEIVDDKIKLTWDEIETPDAIDNDYLKSYFKSLYKSESDQKKYLDERLAYNKNTFGELGYNVYLKDEKGELKLLEFTKDNNYTMTPDSTADYTFVVKTSYSKFKDNISSGKEVTAKYEIFVIDISLNGNTNITLQTGDTYTDAGVKVLQNNIDVTKDATITKKIIRNTDKKVVNNIDTKIKGSYTITYDVKYKDISKIFTRNITINEKPTVPTNPSTGNNNTTDGNTNNNNSTNNGNNNNGNTTSGNTSGITNNNANVGNNNTDNYNGNTNN